MREALSTALRLGVGFLFQALVFFLSGYGSLPGHGFTQVMFSLFQFLAFFTQATSS
jgi:hypothetical protein